MTDQKAPTRPARILVGDMPRMMRDIVDVAIASQGDMELVGHCGASEFDAAVVHAKADVVILAEDGSLDVDVYKRLLCAYPELKVVVVITDGGRRARLVELRHVILAEPSPAILIEAIRTAVQPPESPTNVR